MPLTSIITRVLCPYSVVEKRDSADFDALTGFHASRGVWIIERGMERNPGASIAGGVMTFDQHHFIRCHAGEEHPPMIWTVPDGCDFTGTILINQIRHDQIIIRETGRIAQSQWPVDHDMGDGTPRIDENITLTEK